MKGPAVHARLRTLVFAALLTAASSLYAKESPLTWQRWDHTLISKNQHAHPYNEVTVYVKFTGPHGQSFSTWAYWEEGNKYKIRAAFPAHGKWRWQTTCSDKTDKGLDNLKGSVNVSAYRGDNPLYQKGFLRVGTQGRILTHADNTPFLWMGDTGWHTMRLSTNEEWKKYIDNRAAKGFSVVQVHVTSSREIVPNVHEDMPFVNGVPNNAFWHDMEEKIQYANQKGIVVYMVGLGASGKGSYLPAMNTQRFAEYITGRLAGNFVILSPSMDARHDPRNDQLGTFLKEAGTLHLISQHVGTHLPAAEAYHPKPYLDFTSLQTGHHGGNVQEAYDAARNWSLILWKKQPVKPVINTEGMYDGRGNNEGLHWREMDVRKIGWLSWLSGALGYTYGAGNSNSKVTDSRGGVWLFNKASESYDHWEKAMDWESAFQMSHMKNFFEGITWWQLQPAHELIKNQPTDSVRMMAAAKSANGDLLVAYLPDNKAIELDLQSVAKGWKARWYNPVSGEYLDISGPTTFQKTQVFTTPGQGDWVLWLFNAAEMSRPEATRKKEKVNSK